MKVKVGLMLVAGALLSQGSMLTATAAQLSSDADKISYAIGGAGRRNFERSIIEQWNSQGRRDNMDR